MRIPVSFQSVATGTVKGWLVAVVANPTMPSEPYGVVQCPVIGYTWRVFVNVPLSLLTWLDDDSDIPVPEWSPK